MIYSVRFYGDPILRRRVPAIREEEFGAILREIGDNMLETMYHYNGVGLAGPQVGLAKRIFTAIDIPEERRQATADEDAEQLPEDASMEQKRQHWGVQGEYVMVNPEIISREGLQYGSDGCLSAPGVFYEGIERDARVTVRYHDVEGEVHELEAEGFFAHVLQHEYDHLEGTMFFDRLEPAERRKFLQDNREAFAEMQRDAKSLLKSLRQQPDKTPRLA